MFVDAMCMHGSTQVDLLPKLSPGVKLVKKLVNAYQVDSSHKELVRKMHATAAAANVTAESVPTAFLTDG